MADDRLLPTAILADESFAKSLRGLLELSSEQLGRLAAAVDAAGSFSLSVEKVSLLAQQVNIAGADLADFLAMGGLLSERARQREIEPDALKNELAAIATVLGVGDFEERSEAVLAVLKPQATYLRRVAKEQAETALMTLERAMFWVDLRAVAEEANEVDEYLPVIVARFKFDEHVLGQDALVFQLTEAGLAKVETALENVRKVLAQVKTDVDGKLKKR